MSNELRHYYMQTMGIAPWVPRQFDHSAMQLSALQTLISTCNRCDLHKSRCQTAFARGHSKASLMIILVAADSVNHPDAPLFSKKEGTLLSQMLRSIDLKITDVYISSALKCPLPAEGIDFAQEAFVACEPFFEQEINLVNPDLLFILGSKAANVISKNAFSFEQLRSSQHFYNGRPYMVSYSPRELLENPHFKKQAYDDLQRVKSTVTSANA